MHSETPSNNRRRNFLINSGGLGVSLLMSGRVGHGQTGTANSSKEVSVRTLGTGKQSLQVSALGLGCMGMSYHRSFVPDRNAMMRLIRRAAESGVTLFDTAEVYGPCINEELVGEAVAPIRKDVLICSKFGFNIQNGEMAGL